MIMSGARRRSGATILESLRSHNQGHGRAVTTSFLPSVVNKTFRTPGTAACLVLACVVIASCNRSEQSTKPVKLAFVTNNSSEFWKIAEAGVRKYELEGKVQVDVKLPTNGTPEEQNQILENLASQGYDAIAVSVVAPADQTAALDRIAAK